MPPHWSWHRGRDGACLRCVFPCSRPSSPKEWVSWLCRSGVQKHEPPALGACDSVPGTWVPGSSGIPSLPQGPGAAPLLPESLVPGRFLWFPHSGGLAGSVLGRVCGKAGFRGAGTGNIWQGHTTSKWEPREVKSATSAPGLCESQTLPGP